MGSMAMVHFTAGVWKGFFLFVTAFTPDLVPTQAPVQWVPKATFLRSKAAGI